MLAAARASVLHVGLRRTTLADVARRAGVSRMTIYRQYGDLQAIVSALLTDELLALVESAQGDVDALPTARERLVEAAVLVVEQLAVHPLWRKVLEVDPELLLPLIVDRFGSTQRAVVDLVAAQLARASDGSVPTANPRLTATCLVVAAQSFVFSARVVAAELAGDHETADTSAELRLILDGYLRGDR